MTALVVLTQVTLGGIYLTGAAVVLAFAAMLAAELRPRPRGCLPAAAAAGPWYPQTDLAPGWETEPMPAPVVAEFDRLRAMIDAWGQEGPA